MRRAVIPFLALLLAAAPLDPGGVEDAALDLPGRFELVGSDPLLSRGMNAALAVRGDHVYVGSRTDGTHPNSGILVVDVSEPTDPAVVHQIGMPAAGRPGETSRELRVWPKQDLLIVLNFACNPAGHLCPASVAVEDRPTVRFFDIAGERAARPELVATYALPDNPHEFFLWVDPRNRDRALLYVTTPYAGTGSDIDREGDHLLVLDISRAREGQVQEIARWTPERDPAWDEAGLHSLSVSDDGRRAYLADLEGGLLVADTSELATPKANPVVRQLTPPSNAVHHEVPGAHSAVSVPGRNYAMITDEVYGSGLGVGPYIGYNMLRGCPWGWARLVDLRDPANPSLVGEYKVHPWNDADACDQVDPFDHHAVSYSSHNPTLSPNLALVSWHAAGLQAIDISDPSQPAAAAVFTPDPLPTVVTEDPVLTGTRKVIVWSYPVVAEGLIYLIDIRNGLYILRYEGPHADELRCRSLLEGNSNVGEPVRPCLEPDVPRGG